MLQARERVERLEEEKKKRFEQKAAQHEEKNDKVNREGGYGAFGKARASLQPQDKTEMGLIRSLTWSALAFLMPLPPREA